MEQNHLWYKSAVFYEVYVRAFKDSNGDGHGDLRGLTEKMDYFSELGVDCLWLMPIYPSPLKDDGYDIADYYNVLETYGTTEDFKDLVAAAHSRGIRIITDLVLNHTSDQHPWFQQSRSSLDNPYRNYYVWSETNDRFKDVRIIFLDTEASNWTFDEKTGQYFWHRFYSSQPDLNFDCPEVRAEMKNVMKHWLEMGIDGFRADAIPYLFEREGTNGENLPETHEYLREVRAYLNDNYPGRILLGEANQWPKDVRPYFGNGTDELHMNFHFPLMPRIYMALKQGDKSPLVWVFEQTPELPDTCQWCTFLRNHDELTLEMVTPEERQWMWQNYAPDPRMRLNLGIRRRLAPLLDNDERRIRLANAMLFSLPGAPIIYYGDEIGMGDNIFLFDRNGVRMPMQWNAHEPNGGFSDAAPERLYSPLVAGEEYNPQVVNVESQRADPNSLWNFMRKLIATRKQHAELVSSPLEWVESGCNAVAALKRADSNGSLVCVYNLSDETQRVNLPLDAARVDAFSGREFLPVDGRVGIELEPYGFLWLSER